MKRTLRIHELAKLHGITARTINGWVKEGCPHRKERDPKTRKMVLKFHNDKIIEWLAARGRITKYMRGYALAKAEAPPPEQGKAGALPPLARLIAIDPDQLGLEFAVKRMREQEYRTAQLLNSLKERQAPAGEIAAMYKQYAAEVNALRLAEMDYLNFQKEIGNTLDFAETAKAYERLALSIRNSMLAIPNFVAPQIRPYLARPEDIAVVRDLIEKYCREALEQVPNETPGRTSRPVLSQSETTPETDG